MQGATPGRAIAAGPKVSEIFIAGNNRPILPRAAAPSSFAFSSFICPAPSSTCAPSSPPLLQPLCPPGGRKLRSCLCPTPGAGPGMSPAWGQGHGGALAPVVLHGAALGAPSQAAGFCWCGRTALWGSSVLAAPTGRMLGGGTRPYPQQQGAARAACSTRPRPPRRQMLGRAREEDGKYLKT